MPIFISYARRDADVVRSLHADLVRARHEAWFDGELEGGQSWWDEILARIRACDLFVVALSPEALRSRPCRAELGYALALGRPLLPVLVRDVELAQAPEAVARTQLVDVRTRTPESVIALLTAVARHPPAPPLPDPLPEAPPAPLAERVSPDAPGSGPGTGSAADEDGRDLLRALVPHARAGRCTPLVGLGLTDALIGSRAEIARSWARSFEFPLASHHQDDLAQVAQFVAVITSPEALRAGLRDHVVAELRRRDAGLVGDDLGALLRQAWTRRRASGVADPHTVLARLGSPVYVVAHPWDLMAVALQEEGRDPVVEVCRWRPDADDWPPSPFEADPGYVPTPERPLVYHVFGAIDVPDSLVLTEDDHLDLLASLAARPQLVPAAVRRALADSALALLGFRLEELDVRVLLRALVGQEGGHKLRRYAHVAAQVDLTSEAMSPARAQRYLERWFGRFREPSIDIFWGSVEDFAADLDRAWSALP